MIQALILSALLVPADTLVFSGRDHQLEVSLPRLEQPEIQIDGRLDEAGWESAASLTGFSRAMEGEYSDHFSDKTAVADGLFLKLGYLFRV